MDTLLLKLRILIVFMKIQIGICTNIVAVRDAAMVDHSSHFAVSRDCPLPSSDHYRDKLVTYKAKKGLLFSLIVVKDSNLCNFIKQLS